MSAALANMGATIALVAATITAAAALWLARHMWRDVLGGAAFAGSVWLWLTYGAAFLDLAIGQ